MGRVSIQESTRRPSSHLATSSSHRKLLKEAVLRHSGSFPGPEPARKSPPSPAVTVSPQHSPARSPQPQSLAPPRPLFAPTTLLIGDSITRNIRFFNAATRCLPGPTVPVILDKLPGLLHSLPSSVNQLIFHVVSNDTARQQSELTKNDFEKLFNLLRSCEKSFFISGPIPTLARGAGRFSRILSLHTWLQSACRAHNLGFIDNFNLFWDRPALFGTDGIHPSRLGSLLETFLPASFLRWCR